MVLRLPKFGIAYGIAIAFMVCGVQEGFVVGPNASEEDERAGGPCYGNSIGFHQVRLFLKVLWDNVSALEVGKDHLHMMGLKYFVFCFSRCYVGIPYLM